MNSQNQKDEVYLSSHEVGKLLGYTHDYISRLCRQGHMVGERRGREWFVKPSDIEDFKKNHEVVLQEKKKQLSQKLSEIRKQHEAQKRAQKQISQSQTPSDPVQAIFSDSSNLQSPKIKLSVPRQFVAICILAFALMAPTIVNVVSSTPIAPVAKVSSSTFQTATIVDSYGLSVYQLPRETFSAFYGLGYALLSIYELQGALALQAVQDVSNAGAITLTGYELIGESFVQGVQNSFKYYFNLLFPVYTTYNSFMYTYMQNLHGGYVYAFNQTINTTTEFVQNIAYGYQIMAQNFSHNITAMNQIIQNISSSTYASIGTIFNLSRNTQDDTIEVIKIKQK